MNRSHFRLSAISASLLLGFAPFVGVTPAAAGGVPVVASEAASLAAFRTSGAVPPVATSALAGQRPSSTGVLTSAPEPTPGTEPAVTVTEIPVVVPPVTGGLDALTSPQAPRGEAAGEITVTDEVAVSGRVESEVVETESFQTLGLTWPAGVEVGDLQAQVRTRSDGAWTEWVALEQGDAPDPGTADAAQAVRGGTDPLWVGETDAVQLSFQASDGGGPADLDLVLVGSEPVPPATGDVVVGRTEVDAAPAAMSGVVAAAVTAPRVISRAEWGARPQACKLDVASTLVAAVVHHTAGPNSYSTVAEAMQQIRNDQRYHIEGRGWCDIGYNFIVDKWGNVYEGRANSSTQPVIGVHAGGFNTRTLGVSMLGNYSEAAPPAAVQESVARVIAWRLGAYHRDPLSTVGYTTGGGENSRYPAGTTLALPVVVGHRDVGLTACPGAGGYAVLGSMKSRARNLIGASFVNPTVSASSVATGGSVTIAGGVLSTIDWTLQVTDARTGIEHFRSTGSSAPSGGGPIATWSGRTSAGTPVGPGPYRVTLSGTERGSGIPVVPWSTTVEVTGTQSPPVVAPVPLVGDLRFVPVTPARLVDTRQTAQSLGALGRMDVVVTGRAGVPADAKAVALNVTLVHASTVTHVRAWPAGQARPNASVLNGDAARSASASAITVGVGGEGKISLDNNAGSAHMVVDITGYYTASGGAGYAQLTNASRVLDTRLTGGRLSGDETRTITVGGVGGVPAEAQAVVMNVTSVRSGGNGFVSVVPSGAPRAATSIVNHLPGQDVSNRATVSLAGGKVDLTVGGGPADVVIDVVGWYGAGAGAAFTPIVPVRAFDTRLATGGGALSEGATRTFPVRSVAGLPSGATTALMTLTATQQTAGATYLTAWAAGLARPGTSDLNTGRGRDQSNAVVVGFGPGGSIQVYNNAGTTQVVGDVFGYFR